MDGSQLATDSSSPRRPQFMPPYKVTCFVIPAKAGIHAFEQVAAASG